MKSYFWLLLYNLALVVATGYVVFVMGRSAWWFLLCVLLMASITVDEKKP